MRILVVSDFYPPHQLGGYELACRDAVAALRQRGHEVAVLTSSHGLRRAQAQGGVYRWLEAHPWGPPKALVQAFPKLLRKELRNQRAFRRLAGMLRPDVVYLWNVSHVSISIAFLAEGMGLPTCYCVFDQWLSQWEGDPWYAVWNYRSGRLGVRAGTAVLGPLLRRAGLVPSGALCLDGAHFATRFLQQQALSAGKPVDNTAVTGWGIRVEQFPYREETRAPRRLLFVGRLSPNKGIETALRAVAGLARRPGGSQVSLTVVGRPVSAEYGAQMARLAEELGAQENVRLAGPLPHEQMSRVYRDHDILVFPSVWDEPFGITLLEAMSSGLAVVATGTGGSAEIVEDEVNALIFPRGHAEECAARIVRLMQDSDLHARLRRNGRRTVEERFQFEPVIARIEQLLRQAVTARRGRQ